MTQISVAKREAEIKLDETDFFEKKTINKRKKLILEEELDAEKYLLPDEIDIDQDKNKERRKRQKEMKKFKREMYKLEKFRLLPSFLP